MHGGQASRDCAHLGSRCDCVAGVAHLHTSQPTHSTLPYAWAPTRIKEDAELRLEQVAEGVEVPAVRIQLALVLALGGKHDLQRRVVVQARVLLEPAAQAAAAGRAAGRVRSCRPSCTAGQSIPGRHRPVHAPLQACSIGTHRAVYSNRCSVVGAPSTLVCSTTGEKKPCTVDAASTLSLALPMPSCIHTGSPW